jgi:uncharacterized protein
MCRAKTYNLTILQGLSAFLLTLNAMKLQPDRILGQTVTGHGSGWLAIDGEKFHQSLLIAWSGLRMTFEGSFDDLLSSPELTSLIHMKPEILLLGGGTQKIHIPPAKLARLTAENIGVESMDTAAACRTYNILASENRKVAAILLLYQGNQEKT